MVCPQMEYCTHLCKRPPAALVLVCPSPRHSGSLCIARSVFIYEQFYITIMTW